MAKKNEYDASELTLEDMMVKAGFDVNYQFTSPASYALRKGKKKQATKLLKKLQSLFFEGY